MCLSAEQQPELGDEGQAGKQAVKFDGLMGLMRQMDGAGVAGEGEGTELKVLT